MIELRKDALVFSFPEVHRAARFRVVLRRTLRIPDDGKTYPLPPGLGSFPLRHVDDLGDAAPEPWLRRGGIVAPLYQSEALWIDFGSSTWEPGEDEDVSWYRTSEGLPYPFAVKIATGKIDAVTGETWGDGLHDDPQNYVVVPTQPWVDGYCVEKGLIRQFVAMPLGAGYTAEEQLTGRGEHGGLQIIAYPMKREAYERRLEALRARQDRRRTLAFEEAALCLAAAAPAFDMGLAPGGRMRQELYDDPFDFDEWDTERSSRCFLHLANSLVWRRITGENPPTTPWTSKEYEAMGLPWFEYYAADAKALEGSDALAGLESVADRDGRIGVPGLPENESVTAERIVRLREGLAPGQVREGEF